MHQVDLEPLTSPSTFLLQGEEVPFELKLIGKFSIYSIERKMYYQFYQIYFNVLASHYLLLKLFRISNKSRDLLSQANVILLKQAGLMQLFASLHLAPT